MIQIQDVIQQTKKEHTPISQFAFEAILHRTFRALNVLKPPIDTTQERLLMENKHIISEIKYQKAQANHKSLKMHDNRLPFGF